MTAGLFLAIASVIFVYLVVMMLLPKTLQAPYNAYTKRALERIYREAGVASSQTEEAEDETAGALWATLYGFSATRPFMERMLRAGVAQLLPRFLLGMLGIFFVLMFVVIKNQLGLVGFAAALAITYFLPYMYMGRRINKRNETFINMFPDALDMIVRSVRTGFPMNAALRVVADNMENPIRDEFRQVVDEVAYGRPMTEALARLSLRIDQPDIRFFVIVLSVQQETGGNLSEILSNLSTVIRQRRQLRMKIKAMTAEGRVTGYVLGSLPFIVFGTLLVLQPGHLDPFFYTHTGHLFGLAAIGMIGMAAIVVKSLINIDV